MLTYIEVPKEFNRNAPDVAAVAPEITGEELITLAAHCARRSNLIDADILDVGCGVRFTQTIINREIPIRSYTGIEVHRPIVDFLKTAVEAKDNRFRFVHWDAHNAMYNPQGTLRMSSQDRLPTDRTFDLIWAFSVFTHLNPEDAGAMLRLLRAHVRPNGSLLFSTFIDPALEGFNDRDPGAPLHFATYGLTTMLKMIIDAGWRVDSFHPRDDDGHLSIVDFFVCSLPGSYHPVPQFAR